MLEVVSFFFSNALISLQSKDTGASAISGVLSAVSGQITVAFVVFLPL